MYFRGFLFSYHDPHTPIYQELGSLGMLVASPVITYPILQIEKKKNFHDTRGIFISRALESKGLPRKK